MPPWSPWPLAAAGAAAKTLLVRDRPSPSPGYCDHPALYLVGNAIQPNVPSVTGAPDSWSVTPDLPLGLELDPLLGRVTGTPFEPVPPTGHTVRASLGAASVEVELSIEVRELYFTELGSRTDDGAPANSSSCKPSADFSGGHVAFTIFASNLMPGDTNGQNDVFESDLFAGSMRRVSVSSTGVRADQASFAPAVSRTGRWVAFSSFATTLLVAGDTNALEDVFLHDSWVRHAASARGRAANSPTARALARASTSLARA